MNVFDLLPVGSVVLLKEGEKRLVITGVLQSPAEHPEQTFDYLGVFYPEGHIGDDFQYMFNQEDIAEIFFRGYEDDERATFLSRLSELYGDDSEDVPSSSLE